MSDGTLITLDNIGAALVAITFSGETVNLEITWFPTGPHQNGVSIGRYRAALRGTHVWHANEDHTKTYPLFDPQEGERELAGWGTDPLSALRDLDNVCAAYGWEQVRDADASDALG